MEHVLETPFYNRLKKVGKHTKKWAKREGIFCFRIYDHDIPEYPFCIDIYHEFLHVSEYKSKWNEDDASEYTLWLNNCIATIAAALNFSSSNIYLKERRKLNRRTEQYEKLEQETKTIIAQENNLNFKINLTDYLDTGLFLDHRPLRNLIKNESHGMHVLNLFSYTGSFSVYAAKGNANSVTTVDLSNTYIEWAKENFALNDLPAQENYKFIVSDVMTFLKEAQQNDFKYDLVVVDPPSFSNSKKLKGTWDTQRDHAPMLQLILNIMNENGVIYFSNNFRNFEPHFSRLKAKEIYEISKTTVPDDFRNKNIHKSYKIIK